MLCVPVCLNLYVWKSALPPCLCWTWGLSELTSSQQKGCGSVECFKMVASLTRISKRAYVNVNWKIKNEYCFSVNMFRIIKCLEEHMTIGPRQATLVLIAYASSEGSSEPAHPRSLARTFAARSYKQLVKRNLQTENQIPGPSEWLGMRS